MKIVIWLTGTALAVFLVLGGFDVFLAKNGFPTVYTCVTYEFTGAVISCDGPLGKKEAE